MSLYSSGLDSGSVVVPDQLSMVFDRLGRVGSGASQFNRGGSRFYNRGIQVGANTPGFVGSAVDGLVNLILDLVHVILLVGGGFVLWKAVFVA